MPVGIGLNFDTFAVVFSGVQFGGLRGGRARDADRRRRAEGAGLGLLRRRTRKSRIIEYKPILDRAINLTQRKPEHCVILQRPQAVATLTEGRDLDWKEAAARAEPADCVPVAATDPLYILYTSGTTARPKGVVRDNGGHAVALRWSMDHVYAPSPGEVFWAASDVGWVVGHSYIVYAPLLAGCTTVLYEGKPVGTPDAGAFWRVIAEHRVKALFTAPTAFRAIRRKTRTASWPASTTCPDQVPVPGR